MKCKIIKIEEISDRQQGNCIRISANKKPEGLKRLLPFSMVSNSYDCDTFKLIVPKDSSLIAPAEMAKRNREYIEIDLESFQKNESERLDDIFVDIFNSYYSIEFFQSKSNDNNNPKNIELMEKQEFILENYIDGFFDYAMSRAVELGIVRADKEYPIPELKESAETFCTPIGSFVHKQFKLKYPHQLHLEPIVSGQITAYAGMTAAYLWYYRRNELTDNLLDGNGEYEMNEEGRAMYSFLGIKFTSIYSIDINDLLKEAEDIDEVQKYFLKYLGYKYETEEEINLRGAFNKIFTDFYLKIHEEAKKRNINKPITIAVRTMNLMFKIGLAIGMQKYARKFHIIGWIDGESKNPPRFLVAANPIGKNKDDINYEIDKNTVCFVLPYSLAWFNVIDKYQCDREEGKGEVWEPDMNDYVISPQILSGEEYEGYMHKELERQRKALKGQK